MQLLEVVTGSGKIWLRFGSGVDEDDNDGEDGEGGSNAVEKRYLIVKLTLEEICEDNDGGEENDYLNDDNKDDESVQPEEPTLIEI